MSTRNDLDTATAEREYKAFATMAASFAMAGHGLIKSDPAIDGQAPYYATRWGRVAQPLADLDAAGVYLFNVTRSAGAGKAARRGRT